MMLLMMMMMMMGSFQAHNENYHNQIVVSLMMIELSIQISLANWQL